METTQSAAAEQNEKAVATATEETKSESAEEVKTAAATSESDNVSAQVSFFREAKTFCD